MAPEREVDGFIVSCPDDDEVAWRQCACVVEVMNKDEDAVNLPKDR